MLANRDARIEGNLYLGNLANCPLYIENGDHDPLYPADTVSPIVDAMRTAGLAPVYHIMRNDKHDTHWWPEERASTRCSCTSIRARAHPSACRGKRTEPIDSIASAGSSSTGWACTSRTARSRT